MTVEEALAFAFGKKSGTQLDEQIVMITLAREVERLRDAIRNLRKHGCYPENDGQTHHATCWRIRGHHECAIRRVEELEDLARDIRDNYDCDNDSHRYRTNCRACEAKKILKKGG